jgi:hypothetical protein
MQTAGAPHVITDELARFLESGISVLVGTRDAGLRPQSTRGVGLRVEPGGEEATVFLPAASAAAARANLEENGRIAVCVSRALDNRAVQLKGRVVAVAAGDAAARALVDRYRDELARNLAVIGLPPRVTLRLVNWPVHAVRFQVESVFVQTPGPGAGAPLPDGGGAP